MAKKTVQLMESELLRDKLAEQAVRREERICKLTADVMKWKALYQDLRRRYDELAEIRRHQEETLT